MLQSLKIKNYRNLKDLEIDSLGRINLITGKNNTGKSTLLEAVSLYASKCDLNWIKQLLDERGENYQPSRGDFSFEETNIKTFSSLFSDRKVDFFLDDSISIGMIDDSLPENRLSLAKSVSLRFVKYLDELVSVNERLLNIKKRTVIKDEKIDGITDFQIGLELRDGNASTILPFDVEVSNRYSNRGLSPADNFQLIRTSNIDRDINGILWDSIALTEKENYVIDALRIIEPGIDRIAFVGESVRERATVVKLKNGNNVFPLKSMGDGINRILTIILALINSDNGFLLIDEFENGLHYSVQEQLWKIIFKLSPKLNVQVFATTHSEDCIRGFESVLNHHENIVDGKLIRLDNVNGKIKQTEFTAGELKTAADNDIETR